MPNILQRSSKLLFFSFLLFINLSLTLKAQNLLKKTSLTTSAGGIISTDTITPFLLRSNQYGLVPFKSGIGFFKVNLTHNYDSLYTINKKLKRLGYGYGLELHSNFGKVNQLLFPVAHFKVRYGAIELYAGRRREIQGLVDTIGTMGSYIWSGNALPMPKVEISIPNYTPILGRGLISIKGNYAHGWFGKGDSVQNVWLHHKSFYMRIGKPAWKVKMYGGLNHQVQWGGYPTEPFYDEASMQTVSHYSTDFKTYTKVVTGVSLNKNGDGLTTGVPSAEALNRAGNHLGTIDIGIEYIIKQGKVFLYRQSIFEDGSLYYLNNISDGLYGFTISKQKGVLKNICFEYLESNSQGGKLAADITAINELRGLDNYFNNGIYKDNWTYRQNVIGTPLFNTIPKSPPEINKDNNNIYGTNYIINNRIKAYNISIVFKISNHLISIKSVNYLNLGTYQYNIFKRENSSEISYEIQIKNIFIKTQVSADLGNYWNKNIGINATILKKINF